MRKLILVSFAILLVFTFITLTPQRTVAVEDWVKTYKEDGTPSNLFIRGEKVRIKAYCTTVPYHIIVIDPDGITRYKAFSSTSSYDKTLSGITDKSGWWEVKAERASTKYASAWYNVTPEVPLGVATALTACFAALGINHYRRTRKERPQDNAPT